jgi:hypothetical protein
MAGLRAAGFQSGACPRAEPGARPRDHTRIRPGPCSVGIHGSRARKEDVDARNRSAREESSVHLSSAHALPRRKISADSPRRSEIREYRRESKAGAEAGGQTEGLQSSRPRRQPGCPRSETRSGRCSDDPHPTPLRRPSAGEGKGVRISLQAVRADEKGSTRKRLPVAAKTASATAGPIGATPGSPTPVGASVDGTIWTSTFISGERNLPGSDIRGFLGAASGHSRDRYRTVRFDPKPSLVPQRRAGAFAHSCH